MKNKGMVSTTDNRILSLAMIVTIVLAVLFFLYGDDIDAIGQEPQHYMILRHYPKGLGLIFDCVDEYPYEFGGEMAFDPDRQFTEITARPVLVEQIIEVEFCNVDSILRTAEGDRLFRLGFSEYGEDGQPHFTRGAYWIREAREPIN